MKIIKGDEADQIRRRYIQEFINQKIDYYNERIHTLTKFNDGMCYTGYLWDCYKNAFLLHENQCEEYITSQNEIFIFWDIHSNERILITNYWKFPKKAILRVKGSDFLELKASLPEDIYVFDSSYIWSIAFTHEYDSKQDRFCYFSYSCNS